MSHLLCRSLSVAYKLPQKLPNDLGLGKLGNQEIKRKSQNCVETQANV